MTYLLIILAFAATLISLVSNVVEGWVKTLVYGCAAFAALAVMIVSFFVQADQNETAGTLQETLRSTQEQLVQISAANVSLQAGNEVLQSKVSSARGQISALQQELADARAQISSFDQQAAMRFAISECRAVFSPISDWESIGYVLRNGGDLWIANVNIGNSVNREVYRSGVESGWGGEYAGHIFGMTNVGRRFHEYFKIDGAYFAKLRRNEIDERVSEVYARISELGCEMQFENSVGLVCACE
ncbi:Membrane-bound metallopeptidase [Jannaschia donghaensis]|uniref:Membrane-bound metallopeptidase n=2 Tax=Jannaschia donghaensis TaxID=420998 RepID=A0A0M6YN83_9RHOB|nr:Membrane-bound metallopeptidase [Jannaschia donghaensis]